MTSYVLVHGGFQGGWSYRHVARLLRAEGHEVFTPTLTGLGERSHLQHSTINLKTHIADVVNTILWEDLTDVVLLGHSYGGIVITGVADQLPDRIATLVYLDALVPDDKSTLFSLKPAYLAPFLDKAAQGGGLLVAPHSASAFDARHEHRAWIDAKNTPHPFACFVETLHLVGNHKKVVRRIYVYAKDGPFDGSYDQFKSDPGAQVLVIEDSGHSIHIDQPERVAILLLSAAVAASRDP